MIALFRAELLKARTVRSFWWWTLAAAVGGAAFNALAMVGMEEMLVGTSDDVDVALIAGAYVVAVAGAMGAQLATVEFRFGTASGTFLGEPRRNRVVVAKLLAAAVLAVPVGLLFVLASFAAALPWLLGAKVVLADHAGLIVGTLAAQVGAAVALGAVGAGVGLLVRNHLAGVLLAMLGPLVLTTVGGLIGDAVFRFMPVAAMHALAGGSELLPIWGAVLVLLGWVGLVGAGGAVATRRDVG